MMHTNQVLLHSTLTVQVTQWILKRSMKVPIFSVPVTACIETITHFCPVCRILLALYSIYYICLIHHAATHAARPCDPDGSFIPSDTPPVPLSTQQPDDWTPYQNRIEFELADYLFTENQTPANQIDRLLDIWAASLILAGSDATIFKDHHELYNTIDSTPLGGVKWESFSVKYTGQPPDDSVAPWMEDSYNVWFRDPHEVVRNMLANPDYATEIDLRPYREFSTDHDERQWKDFMSGDWAWNQAVRLSIILDSLVI